MDDEQLGELEQLLMQSEQQYEQSEWEKQLTERIKKTEQDSQQEKRQIEQLNKDLENLRNIRKMRLSEDVAFILCDLLQVIHCQQNASTWSVSSRKARDRKIGLRIKLAHCPA